GNLDCACARSSGRLSRRLCCLPYAHTAALPESSVREAAIGEERSAQRTRRRRRSSYVSARMRNWTELAVGMRRAERIVTVVRMLTVVSMEREQQKEDDYNFALALQLQEMWEEDDEAAAAACIEAPPDPASLSALSVVDEAWELLDPNPDVRALFMQFNEAFFWGRLAAVEVSWSPRMTLCAGVCKYEGNSGMCSIRLSEPLLKLRPRKDLVETLLHEMIHALLFVTNNDRDRDSHGPEFRKHMHRINRLTGANITIYHNFHDEVDSYRQHWWRCNGPCRYIGPYFGYVKRSINRAPSAREFWWAEHQENCGGTFTKVKEPENFSKKRKERTDTGKLQNSKSSKKVRVRADDKEDKIDPKPFSGNEYRLGGADSGLSEKSLTFSNNVTNSERSDSQRRSATSTVPIPKNEIKFEESPCRNTYFPLFTGDASEEMNLASKQEFPKLSVANTKAYKNVNGSPVKVVDVVEENSKQGSAKGKRALSPCYHRSPKQVCLQQTAADETLSDKKKSLESTVQQWPRKEDQITFESYFIKKTTDAALSRNTPLKTEAESAVCSPRSSTAERQEKNVICPVCRTQVLKFKINEHLDFCLIPSQESFIWSTVMKRKEK
ncbi:DNA-dependent metalloprotease SPRTN, partial [Centrocercus urophasianus]|uniref:DNA-dependent metalloprotease SPRTN n=1 Tax=Centrocercus urophasianus TaxID=9002 RepID=UPI001C64F52B